MRPLVALLTDFGTRDHYAGTMKGVIAGICPEAALIDVTHEVPAHDVAAAALELAAAYKYFPAATIFLVVVDPGVGSARRAIAAEAGDYRFVAPDNGVLGIVFRDTPPKKIVELTERRYARPTVSRTFEGRDRFAPAAAWLARGVQLTALGRPLTDWHPLDLPMAEVTPDAIRGTIVRVDRFGNLVTNIERRAVERLAQSGSVVIDAEGQTVGPLVATYGELPADSVGALFGSSDHLELAAPSASAASRLGLDRGASVTVRRR
jgi:S-adenosylmethionine hydrolase